MVRADEKEAKGQEAEQTVGPLCWATCVSNTSKWSKSGLVLSESFVSRTVPWNYDKQFMNSLGMWGELLTYLTFDFLLSIFF